MRSSLSSFPNRRPSLKERTWTQRNAHKSRTRDLLQITLDNQMLNIRPAHHKPLTPPEINRPQLRLNDPAISHNLDRHMQLLRRHSDASHDIQLVRELAAEVHSGRMVAPEIIHFVRAQFAPRIGVSEDMRQGATEVPVHVSQSVEPVRVIREQTALVSQDGGLQDHNRGWRGPVVGCFGDLGEKGFFEVALFADDGADEGVVVFEQGVCLGGSAGLEEELGGQLAVLADIGGHGQDVFDRDHATTYNGYAKSSTWYK